MSICGGTKLTKYYFVNYKNNRFLFLGYIYPEIKDIIEKHNTDGFKNLNKTEIKKLENFYGKELVSKINNDTKIINCLINNYDTILTIQKKIFVFLKENININNIDDIQLWIIKNKLEYSEINSICKYLIQYRNNETISNIQKSFKNILDITTNINRI